MATHSMVTDIRSLTRVRTFPLIIARQQIYKTTNFQGCDIKTIIIPRYDEDVDLS
jgi:hypothetical protein